MDKQLELEEFRQQKDNILADLEAKQAFMEQQAKYQNGLTQ